MANARSHCRIVPLVASFQDAKHLYLVMEYMPGGDFLGLLIRENYLHEAVARFYTAEMILCVEEAHRLQVIHRDIKPDNFLISASGHLKISDFGLAFDGHWSHDMSYYNYHRYSLLAKLGIEVEGDDHDQKNNNEGVQKQLQWPRLVDGKKMDRHQWHADCDGLHEDDEDAMFGCDYGYGDLPSVISWRNRCGVRSSANSCVGTSQYMAPEVVQGASYDGRCDWWSIGIILFECLYGHTPFLSDEGRAQTKRNIIVSHQAHIYICLFSGCLPLESVLVCVAEMIIGTQDAVFLSRAASGQRQVQGPHQAAYTGQGEPVELSSVPLQGQGRPREGDGRPTATSGEPAQRAVRVPQRRRRHQDAPVVP